MKLIFTKQAYESLKETLEFYKEQGVNEEKRKNIVERIFSKTELLITNPYLGREEEYLEHLKLGHRRLIEKHCKIIYKIKGDNIYITDIFDTRQDSKLMKG